jgi:hypothetical protein
MRRALCTVFVRIASAARWTSDVLPYLGPEIIAVMQAAWNFVPNDSRSGPRLTFRESDDRIIPLIRLIIQSEVLDSRTVGVLNFWVHWLP